MHTHACLDSLIERSRFPCVHTYLQKETKARLHSTKTWWKSASSSIGGGARLFSFVAFALAPPLLRFSHSRKREREEDDDDVFPLFLHRASCAKVVSSCAIDRTTRVVEVISTDVFFFSREKRQKDHPARDLPSARVLPRARRHRTTVVETFETRFKRDALSGHRSL